MLHYLTPIEKSKDYENDFFDIYCKDYTELGDKGIIFIFKNLAIGRHVSTSFKVFKNHFKNIKIYNGGFLNTSNAQVFNEVFIYFYNKGILPIFIGVSKDVIDTSHLRIDNRILVLSNQILHFENKPGHKEICYVGYQRHLCLWDDIEYLENHDFLSLSLGKLWNFSHLIEPVLRETSVGYLNLNILKSSEYFYKGKNVLPTGLTVEELCQMTQFLGNADHIRTLIVDYDEMSDDSIVIFANIIATLAWYFCEGYNMRTKINLTELSQVDTFIVDDPDSDLSISFVQSKINYKWYIAHPKKQNIFVACSYEEYQECAEGTISERVVKILENMQNDN